jgi:hypothetical protein
VTEDAHSEGAKRGLFCSVRTDKCECGNEYKACIAKAGWSKYPQKFGKGAREYSAQAHHILCVAAVTESITADDKIKSIVNNTKWCVNDKANMIALPMWPMTLQHYFALSKLASGSATLKGKPPPPPFANLPQHDYDHGPFLKEVNAELKELAKQTKASKNTHKAESKTLKAKLNKLRTKFKTVLKTRGSTRGAGPGTHKSWLHALKKPDSNWYPPFSMAATAKVTPRTFPKWGGGDDLSERLKELQQAFAKL